MGRWQRKIKMRHILVTCADLTIGEKYRTMYENAHKMKGPIQPLKGTLLKISMNPMDT